MYDEIEKIVSFEVLNENQKKAWNNFLQNQSNKGHVNRSDELNDLGAYSELNLSSTRQTIKRLLGNVERFGAYRILEIGSSAGFNCFALRERFPNAEIYGIEPEAQAVALAQALNESIQEGHPVFIEGKGESIPLPSGSFDFIICLTVIEHVESVDGVISEASRLLNSNGKMIIEAPNYIWPYEPHLEIWCIPKLGKLLTAGFAVLQGRKSDIEFLQHLNFVTPRQLEKVFRRNSLTWHNMVGDKFDRVIAGDNSVVKKYKMIAKIILILGRMKISNLIKIFALKMHVYPSVLYELKKQ